MGAIKRMRSGKAVGLDDIHVEVCRAQLSFSPDSLTQSWRV